MEEETFKQFLTIQAVADFQCALEKILAFMPYQLPEESQASYSKIKQLAEEILVEAGLN